MANPHPSKLPKDGASSHRLAPLVRCGKMTRMVSSRLCGPRQVKLRAQRWATRPTDNHCSQQVYVRTEFSGKTSEPEWKMRGRGNVHYGGRWGVFQVEIRVLVNGRPAGEACAVLLAAAGGETSDAAGARKHDAEDQGAAGADRVGCGSEGEPNRAEEGGDGGVSGESFEMRHFRVVFVLRGGRAGPSRVAKVAGGGKNERNGSNSCCRTYNRRWPGGQNGNPR